MAAKIQYGALVTELKGKIGGTVFQSGRYGFQARNKPQAFRNPSVTQSHIRGVILTISKNWRTLTQAERDSWDAVAPSWPAVDAFGNPMLLTGYNVFCKCNFWRWNLANTIDANGSLPELIWVPTSVTLDIQEALAKVEISYAPDPVDNNTTVLVYTAGQVSAGRTSPPSQMAILGTIADGTASPVDFGSDYKQKYGAVPTAGNRIFIGLQSISDLNGTPGPISYYSAIVQP